MLTAQNVKQGSEKNYKQVLLYMFLLSSVVPNFLFMCYISACASVVTCLKTAHLLGKTGHSTLASVLEETFRSRPQIRTWWKSIFCCKVFSAQHLSIHYWSGCNIFFNIIIVMCYFCLCMRFPAFRFFSRL